MELRNVILGTRLNEIQKRPDDIRLVFEDTRTNKIYILNFKGLLFETSGPTVNHRVKNIELNNVLGFRATTQLRQLNRNPENYRQLYIQMEGSNENNKLELLGALRNYKVLPRGRAASKKSSSKKTSVKKSSRKINS